MEEVSCEECNLPMTNVPWIWASVCSNTFSNALAERMPGYKPCCLSMSTSLCDLKETDVRSANGDQCTFWHCPNKADQNDGCDMSDLFDYLDGGMTGCQKNGIKCMFFPSRLRILRIYNFKRQQNFVLCSYTYILKLYVLCMLAILQVKVSMLGYYYETQ